jgi:hypothetical protein
MSKLCEDFIKVYSEYLIKIDDVISILENGEYKKNKISSVTQMVTYQAKLTIKTQELLLEMLEIMNKIYDVLEVRNDKEHDQTP